MKQKSRRVSTTLTRKRLVLTSLLVLSLIMTSCEVCRTVVTQAESKQTEHGEIVIKTTTTESYVGSKKQ